MKEIHSIYTSVNHGMARVEIDRNTNRALVSGNFSSEDLAIIKDIIDKKRERHPNTVALSKVP